MKSRIVIVGAGPVGLEAALAARHAGYEVEIFERGRLGSSMRDWGFVRMFSPFGMNASQLGRQRLAEQGTELPRENELLTGHEFIDRYLEPLAALPELDGCLQTDCSVTGIARQTLLKGDLIGDSRRAHDGFQLRIRSKGAEQTRVADIVLDCSGVWTHPNPAGSGGIPALGERQILRTADYRIPANDHAARQAVEDSVLIIGAGYSAATSVLLLASDRSGSSRKSGRLFWRTRKIADQPLSRIPNDPLPERDRIARQANELATESSGSVEWKSGCVVTELTREPHGHIGVVLRSLQDHQTEKLTVNRVIANVGFRPDRSLIEELQVHECYATHGPIKLAAALLGSDSSDCLDQPVPDADVLRNPEPDYFQLGSRAHGRNPQFLLRNGLEQIETVMRLIGSPRDREVAS